MTETESQWVERARQGDSLAFRRLVDAHARAAFVLCERITRDAALAEDAVQEAFYKAWRALGEFDGRAAFSTWLHRIAANAALEQLRRNARHRHETTATARAEHDDDDEDFLGGFDGGEPGPDDHATGAEIGRRVSAQMQQMSGLERAAFVMRHYEGESLDTISATLSLTVGQSKQAIFRAVRKMRGALQPWR